MSEGHRDRIVSAAARLLAQGGREAVSTRAVCAAAGVQAPTIYRIFGDKQGLLDAVAERGFAAYVGPKLHRRASGDPVEDLRSGWDLHLAFGLANPALYVLMTEPRPEGPPPAAIAGIDYLTALVQRIAEAGRLAVPVSQAVELIHASGVGATLTVLGMPEDTRDASVSRLAREATIAAITTDAPASSAPGPAGAAVALRAALPDVPALSDPERALLAEWLDRIATPKG
jgi:AcrR family transcriptional regulator